jgi:demethylmenaquinone methyltransferase/2-methoxy-6-polyprenyl-1,4-benzoquinol methylase
MAQQFFVPGEQRAQKVKELFTFVARRYDLMNDLQSFGLHRYWKRRVIEFAGPKAGARALDICCGTGDIALGLARRGVQTIGLDFNQEMLRVAEAKAQKAEMGKAIQFVQGDAEAVRFPENAFDIVTVGYGLRNLRSWETGLREMQRVAKPGGRLVVLEFGKPENALWRRLYFAYLRFFVPLLGRVFCGNAGAYAYILESLRNYPAQEGVAAKMRHLGLRDVRIINLLGGVMSINYGVKS